MVQKHEDLSPLISPGDRECKLNKRIPLRRTIFGGDFVKVRELGTGSVVNFKVWIFNLFFKMDQICIKHGSLKTDIGISYVINVLLVYP